MSSAPPSARECLNAPRRGSTLIGRKMKAFVVAAALLGLPGATLSGDEAPRIVLHAVKIVHAEAYRALILEDDYGFVVINDGTEAAPRPRYILGSQREGTVIHYTDRKKFLQAVGGIPTGATLREYTTCLAPLRWGLTLEQRVDRDVPAIAKERGLKFTAAPKTHCTCESSVYPENRDDSGGPEPDASVPEPDATGRSPDP